MDFFNTVNTRCSIRAYEAREVTPEEIERILAAANRAPSAGNLQAYEVVVVRDAQKRLRLAEASFGQKWVATAPVVLVFFTNAERNRSTYGALGESLLALQDATAACAYAELAVRALGLGACWVGPGHGETLREITGAPSSWQPVALLTIGHPAETPEPRGRRPLAELMNLDSARP